MLQADPGNKDLIELRGEIVEGMTLIEESMPEIKEKLRKGNSTASTSKQELRAEEQVSSRAGEPVRFFSSGDHVQAKRRGEPFAPATILTVMGPPSNPNYVVRFKADKSTATVSGHDVRALVQQSSSTENKKRKLEEEDSVSTDSAKPGNIISAPAALNPEFLKQKQSAALTPLDASNEKKSRKVGNKKRLEDNRSSWQNFQQGISKGKKSKDSMFRTGEGVHAKVGVIGSGQGMRKDQKRQKNEYSRADDLDD